MHDVLGIQLYREPRGEHDLIHRLADERKAWRVPPLALLPAAKALLAEGRAPETEIATMHEGSTIEPCGARSVPLGALGRGRDPWRPVAAPYGLAG